MWVRSVEFSEQKDSFSNPEGRGALKYQGRGVGAKEQFLEAYGLGTHGRGPVEGATT